MPAAIWVSIGRVHRYLPAVVAIVMIGVPGVSVAAFDRSHALFDALLHSHVINGRVDYRRLVADPGPLRAYLDSLGAVTAAELATWPHEDQLAFWINAYNAFVLMSVVEYYPLSRHTLVGLAFPANSIWQVPDVWKAARWRAASRTVSLDMIEHEIIRPIFRERRTHFALVCAASSCPNLRSEAYRGDRLDEQLEDQTRRFLADANKGLRLDRGNGKVLLSKIFEWYAADFGQAGGSSAGHSAAERGVVEFVSTHTVDPGVREFLQDPTIRIGYLPYDWTLNDQAPLAGARQ